MRQIRDPHTLQYFLLRLRDDRAGLVLLQDPRLRVCKEVVGFRWLPQVVLGLLGFEPLSKMQVGLFLGYCELPAIIELAAHIGLVVHPFCVGFVLVLPLPLLVKIGILLMLLVSFCRFFVHKFFIVSVLLSLVMGRTALVEFGGWDCGGIDGAAH